MDEMTTWKVLTAIGLLGSVYLLRGYLLIKRNAKNGLNTFDKEQINELSERSAPFRTAEDYWRETENLSNTFTPIHKVTHQDRGRTVISGFAGSAKYVWDGEYLSAYAGQPLLRLEGNAITDVGGNKKFTWKNGCLSIFAGKNLFTVSDGIVSLIGKGPLYRYTEKDISEFGGSKVLSLKGDVPVPEAIIGVLIIMIRNFSDVD